MQKRYTEADLLALIEQKKIAIARVQRLQDDPEHAQRQLKEMDEQIAAIQRRREELSTELHEAEATIETRRVELDRLRKKLSLVRAGARAEKYIKLVAQIAAYSKE